MVLRGISVSFAKFCDFFFRRAWKASVKQLNCSVVAFVLLLILLNQRLKCLETMLNRIKSLVSESKQRTSNLYNVAIYFAFTVWFVSDLVGNHEDKCCSCTC